MRLHQRKPAHGVFARIKYDFLLSSLVNCGCFVSSPFSSFKIFVPRMCRSARAPSPCVHTEYSHHMCMSAPFAPLVHLFPEFQQAEFGLFGGLCEAGLFFFSLQDTDTGDSERGQGDSFERIFPEINCAAGSDRTCVFLGRTASSRRGSLTSTGICMIK
jgi:hypothetical protein